MRMTATRAALPVVSLALAAIMTAGAARAEKVAVQYDITLAGLTFGRADVAADISSGRYSLDVNARTAGLASVSKGAGRAQANGAIGGVIPNSTGYAMTAQSSDGPRTVRMSMAGGSVRGAEINPPVEAKPDRVPVTDAHKRGVLDPVSALIMPQTVAAGMDASNCNRTLPIFDGAARYDIVLSYKGTKQVKTKGYEGPVLICSARYVPHAGHRAERKVTQFMANNRDMEAWLAPVNGTRVLMPYKIAVKTMVGTAVIEAANFSTMTTTGSVR
ncbi:MAG: DUF3108 domain-containing protein [Beijerinckiaceae bacterium]